MISYLNQSTSFLTWLSIVMPETTHAHERLPAAHLFDVKNDGLQYYWILPATELPRTQHYEIWITIQSFYWNVVIYWLKEHKIIICCQKKFYHNNFRMENRQKKWTVRLLYCLEILPRYPSDEQKLVHLLKDCTITWQSIFLNVFNNQD